MDGVAGEEEDLYSNARIIDLRESTTIHLQHEELVSIGQLVRSELQACKTVNICSQRSSI